MTLIPPALGPGAMKTYQVTSPLTTHFRETSCAEVDCPNHANGWVTAVDESTDLGARQASYIRRTCRPAVAPSAPGMRRYTETRTEAGWTAFRFDAGQECFGQHRLPLDRPEIYIVRGGDRRGNPRGERYLHHDAEGWVEDFAEHQDSLARIIERG